MQTLERGIDERTRDNLRLLSLRVRFRLSFAALLAAGDAVEWACDRDACRWAVARALPNIAFYVFSQIEDDAAADPALLSGCCDAILATVRSEGDTTVRFAAIDERIQAAIVAGMCQRGYTLGEQCAR